MAFKVEKVNETSTSYEVGETLWLNADRSKVVADGDPDAAFLLATAGKRLSVEEAELYGLAGKAKAKAATKEAAPAEDKKRRPAKADDGA